MNQCIPITILKVKKKIIIFLEFYDYLAARNFVIYPGKKTKAPTFRIGSIGDLDLKDFKKLLKYIDGYLAENKIPVPVPY